MDKMTSSYYTFPRLFRESVGKFADITALSYVDGSSFSYRQVGEKVAELHLLFDKLGLVKGDKVAILGQNMPNWGVAFFSIVVKGLVVVPLLPDFKPDEICNILSHSEAKAIFVSDRLMPKLAVGENASVMIHIKLDDFSLCKGDEAIAQNGNMLPNNKDNSQYEVKESDLAAIIYTSGTTGRSKGVMLTHRNLIWHTSQVHSIQYVGKEMTFLSILPLSHMYENSLGLVLPFMYGATVYYIEKPPTPNVLMPALKKVRPHYMLTVPLIMEKIYKNQVKAKIEASAFLKNACKLPLFRKSFFFLAGKKLKKTFGGRLVFFGIGGAKLDSEVEKFLLEAKFPYAIGYGLTECSPLLAGVNPQTTMLGTTGLPMRGISIRLAGVDPETGIGEMEAKGDNIMPGYYKDSELTKEVFTEDGWFKTGDLASMDKKGRIFIKGRSKNVILGSSGENIYPEDIEFILNNEQFVLESIVGEKKGKLVAMVHLNQEGIEKHIIQLKQEAITRKNDTMQYLSDKYEDTIDQLKKTQEEFTIKYEDFLENMRKKVNARLNRFSQIQYMEAVSDPFEKTATQKIKRHLYFRSSGLKEQQDVNEKTKPETLKKKK